MSDNASETDPISSSEIETSTSADESEIVAEEQLIGSSDTEKNITTERYVEEEEDLQLYSLEDIRLKTKKFLTNSRFGMIYENIMLVISVASAIEYHRKG